jgi:hypothetical protein
MVAFGLSPEQHPDSHRLDQHAQTLFSTLNQLLFKQIFTS